VLENNWLGHVYFGPALAGGKSYGHLVPGEFYGFSNRLGQPVPLEYPSGGAGDYRIPALAIELPNGSGVLDLQYKSHRVTHGKPSLAGLPATYVEVGGEAETLEILMGDHIADIEVRLLYTIYRDRPVVVRSARIANTGKSPVIVRCAMSASLDIPDSEWQLLTLSGEWPANAMSNASTSGRGANRFQAPAELRVTSTTPSWPWLDPRRRKQRARRSV